MRGRTNAESGNGVIINATVDTFEVTTGETILAGDFVEQYEYATGQLTGVNLSTTNSNLTDAGLSPLIHKMSNGKYVSGTYIINKDSEGVYSLDTTASSSYVTDYLSVEMGNDVCVGISDSLDYRSTSSGRSATLSCTVAKYDSTENTITRRTFDTLGFYDYSTSNTTNVLSNLKLVPTSQANVYKGTFVHGKSVNSGSYSYTLVTFDATISGTGYDDYTVTVNNVVTTSISGVSKSPSVAIKYFVRISASEDYLIGYQTSGNATYKKQIQFNNGTFGSPYDVLTSMQDVLKSVADDGYVDFYYGTTRKRVFYTVGSTDYNAYEDETITDDVSTPIYRYVGTKNNVDIYLIYVYNSTPQLIPFNIDRTTGVMTVGATIQITPTTYVSTKRFALTSFDNNTIVMTLGQIYADSSTPLFEFEYVNGIFNSVGVTVKKVRGITTQNYIKGVAKQSGTAGDTIEVYVPTINS